MLKSGTSHTLNKNQPQQKHHFGMVSKTTWAFNRFKSLSEQKSHPHVIVSEVKKDRLHITASKRLFLQKKNNIKPICNWSILYTNRSKFCYGPNCPVTSKK